jgi:hypothetical protein
MSAWTPAGEGRLDVIVLLSRLGRPCSAAVDAGTVGLPILTVMTQIRNSPLFRGMSGAGWYWHALLRGFGMADVRWRIGHNPLTGLMRNCHPLHRMLEFSAARGGSAHPHRPEIRCLSPFLEFSDQGEPSYDVPD